MVKKVERGMQHYEKNVVSVSVFCPTCNRLTQHKVTNRRVSDCLEHESSGMSKAQKKRQEDQKSKESQPELF